MEDDYEIENVKQRDAATTPRRAIGTSKNRCILETEEDGPMISPARQGRSDFRFDFAKAWGDAGIALEFGESLTDTKSGSGGARTGERSRERSNRTSPSRESRSYGSEREGPVEGRRRQQGRTSREPSLSGQSDSRASTISMSRSQYSAISSSMASSSQDSTYSSTSSSTAPSTALQRPKERTTVGRWQPSTGPKDGGPPNGRSWPAWETVRKPNVGAVGEERRRKSPDDRSRGSIPPSLERSRSLQPQHLPGLNRDAAPFNPAGRPATRGQQGPPGLHARAQTDMGPIQGHEYAKDGPMKGNVAANTRKNTVFVKGFDYEVSKDTLYKYFSTCGDITNIALPRCRKRGRSRRLAWITFDTAEAVEAALRCDGSVLNTDPKRVLQISIAQPPRPKNAGPAKKDEKGKNTKKRGRAKQQHPSLIIGDVVLLDLSREGVVKYIGTVRFAPGEWIGIELNNHSGKHNGVINGYRYFQCSNNKGIFVKRNRIRKKIGHDPQVSRAVQFGPAYENAIQSQFGYRKKVHSRNVSLMDSAAEDFPEFRAPTFGGEQSRPTSSKHGPPIQREFGARFSHAHPFGRPPAGFGAIPPRPFPPFHRSNNNPSLSGPPPHPPHGRPGLAVRRPMPAGPPNAFDMSHFTAHLGPPGPGPSRGPNRSPPGIQPRSLSGVVSLDDADDTNGRDLSPPRTTSPEVQVTKAPEELMLTKADEPSKLLVSG